MDQRNIQIQVDEKIGEVSGILQRPDDAKALLVFAHGAGAGMQHPFMTAVAEKLAARGMGTFRYQFPYMEQGRKAPNPQSTLVRTVRAAVETAASLAEGLPLFAGGKSMGGRMTSLAAAEDPFPQVRGLVFFGFPLHAPGKPSKHRGDHLHQVRVPMLFLQGTRDKLADLSLLTPLCESLGKRAHLHIVEGGDHSFHVLKRSGRTDDDALDEVVASASDWMTGQGGR